jgi:peptidoglycan/LPS O-acetylase OafA/YrhL
MLTGFLTYGIYLWHYVIIRTRAPQFEAIARWIGEALALNPWGVSFIYHTLQISVSAALSYLLAYVSFILIENRFRPDLYAGIGAKRTTKAGSRPQPNAEANAHATTQYPDLRRDRIYRPEPDRSLVSPP